MNQLAILATKAENFNCVINKKKFQNTSGCGKIRDPRRCIAIWLLCILIKSYDCTFIESLYMYQPYLTYSNKNSVPPVMTKWSIIGYREEINCSSLHSGNIVAKSWDKISFKFWPLIMHLEQVYTPSPPYPLTPFTHPLVVSKTTHSTPLNI